ncbi:MAG TPA: LysE family transporter [Candidatus Stackebrandtia faecavium]|nr:LysE family transporter [Candidatus Stackebrandtia faecavium]
MTIPFLTGLLFGLGLIIPIGAQNVFVFSQGLAVGMPRALWAVLAAACCDSLLIVAGAAGAASLLQTVPGLQAGLLAGGAVFLTYLGVKQVRSKMPEGEAEVAGAASGSQVLRRTISASLLNPHAIVDTVGVLGAAIATQSVTGRTAFAAGTISASWLWFLVLAICATALRGVLTARRRVWFDRISGVILCAFAVGMAVQFYLTLAT